MIEEESKNFRLIGHDPSAAFGCGSLVEISNGHAYVGSLGVDGVEGFTVHDVRDHRGQAGLRGGHGVGPYPRVC